MSIKMTKKGNAKLDGVKYKAVPGTTCEGCAFYELPLDCDYALCTSRMRNADGYTHQCVSVIFVKKEKRNATNT